MSKKDGLQKLLEEASKDATVIVSNPDTVKNLQAKGIPIEEKFIPYDEYFENLISEKKKTALALLKELPLLDNSIANSITLIHPTGGIGSHPFFFVLM